MIVAFILGMVSCACNSKPANSATNQPTQPLPAATSQSVHKSDNATPQAQFTAKVLECAPFSGGDVQDTKHFRLLLEVQRVDSGQYEWLKPGAAIELFIHSPTRSFPPTSGNPMGRVYTFSYLDTPSAAYRGDVRIR